MVPNEVEREIAAAAPIERVWAILTESEHFRAWFAFDGAEIDLRPGGPLSLSWSDFGTFHGRVESVEPPHRVAYRWLSTRDSRAEPTPANSTLIEFTLAAEGDGTRVAVIESGFDGLDVDPEERAAALASHTRGWTDELGELAEYVRGVAAGR